MQCVFVRANLVEEKFHMPFTGEPFRSNQTTEQSENKLNDWRKKVGSRSPDSLSIELATSKL
jgi:hypothetical protein